MKVTLIFTNTTGAAATLEVVTSPAQDIAEMQTATSLYEFLRAQFDSTFIRELVRDPKIRAVIENP